MRRMLMRMNQRYPDRRLAAGQLAAESDQDAAELDGGEAGW